MIFSRLAFTLSILSLLFTCNTPQKNIEQDVLTEPGEKAVANSDAVQEQGMPISSELDSIHASTPDTAFVVMNKYARGFAYDMKYATDDNFLKKTVYSCDQCLIRKEVADALKQANDNLSRRGLRIKFFDCYRPLDIQKQMWDIHPDANYVANPHKTGSIHNRGGAVDITLVNLDGQELDMGTAFDHFGKEAHHAYTSLPDTVLSNRHLLKKTMEAYGFSSIASEWWHYNYKSAGTYSLSNFSVECD